MLRPISFSPDGSLFTSRSLHKDKPALAPPFTATSAETLNASEASLRLRALSGVAADNALKNSLLIRTGGGLVTSSKLSAVSSSSSSSNVNTSTSTHTGTEELSNMYSWLDIVGQQLTVVPTPLSSTAESLMLQSSSNSSFPGNSSMDVLELQHLFSKIGGVRVQSVVKRQNLINEDERENEDYEKTELNDDASYHRLNASKETPCGPLTAYVGSQREAALALCGWSPLLSSPFEDSMIDPQTGEPFLSIDALASSVPVPLIKTCCLAANSKVGENSDEVATTKHTGIERSAAIALFHGFSGIAVQLLQLTASSIQEKIANSARLNASTDSSGAVYTGPSVSHAELLQLVAMAAAGCPGPVVAQYTSSSYSNNEAIPSVISPGSFSSTSSSSFSNRHLMTMTRHDANDAQQQQRDATRSVWLSSCRSLLNKVNGRRHPYLKVMLTVLVEVSDPAINKRVTPMPDKLSSKDSTTSTTNSSDQGANTKTTMWNTGSIRNQTPHRIDTLYPQLLETSRGGLSMVAEEGESSQQPSASSVSSLASPNKLQQHPTTATTPPLSIRSQSNTEVVVSPSATLNNQREKSNNTPLMINTSMTTTSNRLGLDTPKQPLSTDSGIISPPPLSRQQSQLDTGSGKVASLRSSDIDASITPEDQIEISLQDRVAFACRFLDDASLSPYIRRITAECLATGRIDGLLLTGLTPKGSTLVQNYLDRRASSAGAGDVQTAAIVGVYFLRAAQLSIVKRVKMQHTRGGMSIPLSSSILSLLTPGETIMVRRAWRWIIEYRTLLNKWQLWSQRALFDVQRSKILGFMYKPGKTTSEGGGLGPLPSSSSASISISAVDVYTERGIAELLHNCCIALSTIEGVVQPFSGTSSSSSSSVQLSLMTLPLNNQAFLRCSSCHTSLHLPSLVEHSATAVEWLRKQRPRMLLCPSCGKSLPRCELCLLPLGCINPVMQLQHELSIRNSPHNSGIGGRTEKQEGGRLRDSSRLEDFWSFCNSCKHGGHSSHLAEWFATKTVCPVAECMCHCVLQDSR